MESTPGKKKMIVHEQGEKAVRDKLSEEMHQSAEIKETADDFPENDDEDLPLSEAETESMQKLKKYLLNRNRENKQWIN